MQTIYLPYIRVGTDKTLAVMEKLIIEADWQERPIIEIDQGLMDVAMKRAEFICNVPEINAVQSGHTFPGVVIGDYSGDKGPNEWLRDAGIKIPDWYPDGNTVESFATGQKTPQEAIQAWLNSPPHKLHLSGGNDYYKNQKRVGFGAWFFGNFDPAWVFLSCHEV